MHTIVNKREESQLRKLLALAPMPEMTFTYDELLGYLYGIAITPDLIPPYEWIPVMFGEGMPEYDNEQQAREMMDALLSCLNRHISGFHDGSLVMPFDIESLGEKDVHRAWEWTSGFEEALSLRPECWEEDQEGFVGEGQEHLMNSLIVIEGVAYPDEAVDMFDHISKDELTELGVVLPEDEIEKVMQVQAFMFQALELAVETIQHHGAKLEAERQDRILFPGRSSAVKRNDACPCGSGKKYIQCCGKKKVEKGVLYDVKSKKGSGKSRVIHGVFPRHGKFSPAGKEKPGKRVRLMGESYLLEITLACTEPPVWRRIQVPASITLADLHTVIQFCMGWQDMHMHQFQAGQNFYGPQMVDDYNENLVLDESRLQLLKLERELLQGMLYTYDFGDNWEHVIMLEKVILESEGEPLPILIDGGRACPPEDIGGVPGYLSFLETLGGAGDEENEDMPYMADRTTYDPDLVPVDAINHMLRIIYGKD